MDRKRRSIRIPNFAAAATTPALLFLLLALLQLVLVGAGAVLVSDTRRESETVSYSTAVATSSSFCSRALTRKVCPLPTTFDAVAIRSYLGRWYEIGSTALFKFTNENGAICIQANYSVSTSSASSSSSPGLNISLINSDLRVLGPSSSLGVSVIAAAARRVCSSARKICSLVGAGDQLQNVAHQIREVVDRSPPSQEASIRSILNTTANQISATLSRVQSGLNLVSDMMTRVQTATSHLSQNSNYTSSASSIATLKDLVRTTEATLSSLEMEVMKLSVGSADELQTIVDSLLLHQDSATASKIIEASVLVDEGKATILSHLQLMRLSLDGLSTNVPLLFSVDQMATNYSSYGKISYVRGSAIQDPSSAGKLEVIIDGFSGPYWILDLVGQAKDGYSAALVYGCVEDGEDDIREDVFILSRKRNLSMHVVDRFMQIVGSRGINTDCEDPFLYTRQLGGNCGAPPL